uniref:starch synthase n=1 Tax=Arundo donax TaxID=35708 RepID=A0A0A9B3R1_ARUDO
MRNSNDMLLLQLFSRFSYFSRASLDYIVKSGKQPDILHIHNWKLI